MKVKFTVVKRLNTFSKNGSEYALNVIFIEDNRYHNSFTVTTFEEEPKFEDVERIKRIIMRTCMFYHNSIKTKDFFMVEE